MEANNASVGYAREPLEGRVFYTHCGGLDHPLSIGRMDISAGYMYIVHVSDWRGNAIAGYCGGTTLCTEYQWPQEAASPWDQSPPPDGGAPGPTTWKGILVDTHTDGSDLVYKRNRYYDAGSGRFTQEDPIGLAGGLNAYGFAGGDPVNYADPFGLCPPATDSKPCGFSDLLVINVSFGGQADLHYDAGITSGNLRVQIGPVGNIAIPVGKNKGEGDASLTVSDSEVSIESTFTLLGHGGGGKCDAVANKCNLEKKSEAYSKGMGSEKTSRLSAGGKANVGGSVGIGVSFDINWAAAADLAQQFLRK